MKKLLLILSVITLLLSSCAKSKEFHISDTETIYAEPYGWGNYQTTQIDTVVYDVNVGNVIWSVILLETIIAPVYFTGWSIMEPVRLKTKKEYEKNI